MPNTAQRALKVYLWFIAAFHLFVGLSVNLSTPFTQAIAAGYGAQVDWTAQFVYILHPLGAFMIVLGVLAAAAARDPQRYEAVVLGFVLLFAIRAVHRIVFGDVLASAYGIAPSRNTINMVIFAVQAVVLFLLWRASRDPARTASFATS
jgi:hypothetical protein